ncbi:MAG: hypothetical protein KME20_03995 [Kaiparowitsia implicata GSE-PSE-MK54-09C]|jgi:hypothetical protein|nr:hypothetical protein [Kaiparowitsia implicata GSE-PSE-MK54-09C]
MTEPHQALAQLAETILQNPVLLGRLCDRIYDLLTTEVCLNQERTPRRL